MKHSQTIKGYCAGLLTAVLISGMAFSTDAASLLKEIKVSIGGIQIYVDGNLKKPVDANGNTVEPLIYNGTTYLPVRALTNMLTDKEVNWDGNTQTVYIGKRPENGGKSVAIDTLKPYSGPGFLTGAKAQFQLLDKTITPFNSSNYSTIGDSYKYSSYSYTTYILDSKYNKLNGQFVIPYTSIGNTVTGSLTIYNVDQYGSETELAKYEAKAGDNPIDISVNISGCNIIKIQIYNAIRGFYDVTLTTAN